MHRRSRLVPSIFYIIHSLHSGSLSLSANLFPPPVPRCRRPSDVAVLHPVGNYHPAAEPIAGHTRYKLSYDGAVLPHTSGVDFVRPFVGAICGEARTFNLARGRRHLLWLLCWLAATTAAWYFINVFFFPWFFDFLNNSVSFGDTLNSGIIFTVYYLIELAVFNLPGYVVDNLEKSFDELYTNFQKNVFDLSQDVRLVLRFAKGTRHRKKVISFEDRVVDFLFCLKVPWGVAHQYDLHVLPRKSENLTVLTVRCPTCKKKKMVEPSETRFRCMQCLACVPLGLPTLAAHDDYRSPSSEITAAARFIPQWSSAPPRVRFRRGPVS